MVKKSTKKVVSKKSTKKAEKVDFEPNKMTVAIASTAVVCLLLFAVIAMQSY